MCFRYINVFFLRTHGEENLQRFLDNLSNFDPNINFIYEYSKNEMPFLDLKVGIKNGNITTDLYVRDTDRHQYFHYFSAQPNVTKISVFSQPLRLRRLSAFGKDFERHIAEIKQCFDKRDYPQDLINSEIDKVQFPYVGKNTTTIRRKDSLLQLRFTHYLNLWVVFLIRIIIF